MAEDHHRFWRQVGGFRLWLGVVALLVAASAISGGVVGLLVDLLVGSPKPIWAWRGATVGAVVCTVFAVTPVCVVLLAERREKLLKAKGLQEAKEEL